MYSILGYGKMIADAARMQAYSQALRQAVKPGAVVLDIGTGTGIMAMLACQFGARRVYAIEPDDSIEVARKMAVANGFGGRIEFIQDLSTRAALPERADVIVSDLRGVLPLFQYHIPSIIDARQRLLVPGGALISQRDRMWAAVVEAPDLYNKQMAPWGENSYGLNLQAARHIVANTWRKGRVSSEQLLLEPQRWAELDYCTIEGADISGDLIWTVRRPGTGHGIIVWFDATLAPGVSFSNAPGAPELIYGNAVFLWPSPVTLAAGDSVTVLLKADLIGDDYIWCWNTSVLGPGNPGALKADFKQSTFFGAPLSPARLHKRAASHVPRLGEEGRIDQFILSRMDGETSLGDIARLVSDTFPTHFRFPHDALTRVSELSVKYSR